MFDQQYLEENVQNGFKACRLHFLAFAFPKWALNTEQSYKRQGHATFEALCWLFCATVESRNNGRVTWKS